MVMHFRRTINCIGLLLAVQFLVVRTGAQLLNVTPDFPVDNSDIVITVDCNKGNQGLLNYSNAADVYAHVGVITNLSTNQADWKYVKFVWGTTNPSANAV